jgi:hypothetical protein
MTLWLVTDPGSLGPVPSTAYDQQIAMFVHLVDGDGQPVAQDDRLGVPAWQWRAGDRFAQLHHLTLPSDLPIGDYRLLIGLYTLPDMVRLPLAGGGDSWELRTVEVDN